LQAQAGTKLLARNELSQARNPAKITVAEACVKLAEAPIEAEGSDAAPQESD
jgi:hypothetical protein